MTSCACPPIVLVALAALGASGCGAEGQSAPVVGPPRVTVDERGCPSTGEALDATKAALRDGPLAALGPHVSRILVDDGGIRVVVPVVLDVMRAVPVGGALAVTDGFEERTGLARLLPHLGRVLDYVIGASPHVAGEHYDVMSSIHGMIDEQGPSCDALAVVSATRRLLDFNVVDESGALVPWIEPFFDAVVALAEDDAFQALLESVELDEEDDGSGIHVGRDAFILIARLLTANLAADDLDLEYVRGLAGDLLTLQLPEGESAARAKLDRVLDYLTMVVDPDLDVFPYAQALIRCANEVDDGGFIPGMLYDYLAIEDLSFVEFLRDIDAVGSDPAGTSLRLLLEDAIIVLESEPLLAKDALRIVNRFFAPEIARELLPALRALEGSGVLTELVHVARRFVVGCEDVP